jgi:hypothetical protein
VCVGSSVQGLITEMITDITAKITVPWAEEEEKSLKPVVILYCPSSHHSFEREDAFTQAEREREREKSKEKKEREQGMEEELTRVVSPPPPPPARLTSIGGWYANATLQFLITIPTFSTLYFF